MPCPVLFRILAAKIPARRGLPRSTAVDEISTQEELAEAGTGEDAQFQWSGLLLQRRLMSYSWVSAVRLDFKNA
jgi:hypothetical protein